MFSSLVPLRAFMETARLLSFSRAAESLGITQSAVSKQVQALEQQLGVQLFERHRRALVLTPAANAYLPYAAEALARLEEGRLAARLSTGEEPPYTTLEISASPAFAAQWLIPRLGRFLGTGERKAQIRLRPRLPDLRPAAEHFDLEIRLGGGRWPRAHASYLLGREMALVASPVLLQGRRIRMPADLSGLPILGRAQRGYDWAEWSAAIAPGWSPEGHANLIFEGFSVLVPAAVAGLGLAICPLFLVLEELETGRLVRPLGECVRARHAYHAVVPAGAPHQILRDRFLDWLQAEAKLTRLRLDALLRPGHSTME